MQQSDQSGSLSVYLHKSFFVCWTHCLTQWLTQPWIINWTCRRTCQLVALMDFTTHLKQSLAENWNYSAPQELYTWFRYSSDKLQFIVFLCGLVMAHFAHVLQGCITGTGAIIWYDCPSASETTLLNMGICITWSYRWQVWYHIHNTTKLCAYNIGFDKYI